MIMVLVVDGRHSKIVITHFTALWILTLQALSLFAARTHTPMLLTLLGGFHLTVCAATCKWDMDFFHGVVDTMKSSSAPPRQEDQCSGHPNMWKNEILA